jgi:hypothetical protein
VPLSLMTLLSPGADRADAEARLDRMSARFRGPRERLHAGGTTELADLLRGYSEAGVERAYLQFPDRGDFRAIELLGELAGAVAEAS